SSPNSDDRPRRAANTSAWRADPRRPTRSAAPRGSGCGENRQAERQEGRKAGRQEFEAGRREGGKDEGRKDERRKAAFCLGLPAFPPSRFEFLPSCPSAVLPFIIHQC